MSFPRLMLRNKHIILIFAVYFGLHGHAQLTENSPYSRYALGILNSYNGAHMLALGNPFAAYTDSANINPVNPASWSFLALKRPIVYVQTKGVSRWMETSSGSDVARTFALSHFGLGIPISKKAGFGFGISPFSRTGYIIEDSVNIEGIGAVEYLYDGFGDLNQAYIGGSWKPIYNKRIQWSIGVNAAFIFGKYTHNRRTNFNDITYLNTLVSSNTQVNDIKFDVGTILQGRISGGWRYNLGAVLTLPSRINGKRDEVAMTLRSNGLGGYFIRDTAYYLAPVQGNITLPQTIEAGFMLDYRSPDDAEKNPNQKAHRLLITGNFSTAYWSNMKNHLVIRLCNKII